MAWYRKFEGDSSGDLRCSIGACNVTATAATLAALVRKVNDPPSREEFVATHNSSGVHKAGLGTGIDPDHYGLLAYGTHSTAEGATITFQKSDGWAIVVFTHTGVALSYGRFHAYKAGSWEHVQAKETASTPSTQAGGSVRFASISGIAYFDLEIALAAIWKEELSDSEIETLSTNRATQDWLDLSPSGCWEFGQTSTSMAVEDLTGNGADQTSVAGSTAMYDPGLVWEYSQSYLPDVSPSLPSYVHTAGRGQ